MRISYKMKLIKIIGVSLLVALILACVYGYGNMRDLMPGEFRFGIGLSNDEVGHIIPKSQWDVKEPYVYRDKPCYGEQNSLGPETAPPLYRDCANSWRSCLLPNHSLL